MGAGDEAAADDFEVAAEEAVEGFGVGDVFFVKDVVAEVIGGPGGVDRDGALDEDDAVVELLVDEVDGAAGDADAVLPGLVLGVEAGEGGEEGGVDVEDAVREGLNEGGGEQAEVAGEADEIDAGLVEVGEELLVMLGAFAAGGWDGNGGIAEGAGVGEAGGVRDIGKDNGDFGAGEMAVADGAIDGAEVGTAAGEEDAETSHEGPRCRGLCGRRGRCVP